MGLRSPYPARIPLSVQPPRGLPADAAGGCEIFVRMNSRAPRPLRFGLAKSCTNLKEKNRKPVARRHVVGGIAQSPHGLRTISVRRMRRLHGNCTDIFRTISSCTVSVRVYPGLPPRPPRRNRTMPVDNVNTYAVARSHLRCPKNRTENRRQIHRTASGAKVN